MNSSDIATIISKEIAGGETNRVEFKEDIPDDHTKVIKTVVAFSNTAGGRIFFGVSDSGKVVGIPDDMLFAKKDQITNMIVDSCQPMVAPDIFITTVDGRNVIVVDVLPGYRCPYYIKSEGEERGTYVRVSGISVVADDDMFRSLKLRGANISFDALDCPTVGIDKESIEELCDHLSSKRNPIEEINLLNMGVIRKALNDYIATNTYALLTANPFLYARIQCARFRGKDDLIFADRKDYGGCIVDQAVSAVKFVIDHINVGAVIKDVVREDVYEIPKEAIREAIVNAVVHRDYALKGISIFVKVFDDRVVIESPGLSLGVDVGNPLSGRSVIRNEIIASVFKSTGMIEAYGTGIKRMVSACRESGIPDPVFEEDGVFFRVTFARAKSIYDTINEKRVAIMNAISNDKKCTQKQISKKTGIPYSTVKRIMRVLQENGSIERVGDGRCSEWFLND